MMATLTPEEFSARLNRLTRTGGMMRVLAQVATETALTMDREAKMRTTGGNPLHVRTGKLRQSIKIKTEARANSVTAEVQAGGRRAYYARFHEFGEGRMPRRPFLAPAREVAISKLDQTLIDRTRAALRTVGIGA